MEYLTEQDYRIAAENGINKHNAYQRFYVYCWTKEKAITEPMLRSRYEGYEQKCKDIGLSFSTFKKRVQGGMGLDDALYPTETIKRKLPKELLDIAEMNGISRGTVQVRVYKYKWEIERAITEPVNKKFSSVRAKAVVN